MGRAAEYRRIDVNQKAGSFLAVGMDIEIEIEVWDELRKCVVGLQETGMLKEGLKLIVSVTTSRCELLHGGRDAGGSEVGFCAH